MRVCVAPVRWCSRCRGAAKRPFSKYALRHLFCAGSIRKSAICAWRQAFKFGETNRAIRVGSLSAVVDDHSDGFHFCWDARGDDPRLGRFKRARFVILALPVPGLFHRVQSACCRLPLAYVMLYYTHLCLLFSTTYTQNSAYIHTWRRQYTCICPFYQLSIRPFIRVRARSWPYLYMTISWCTILLTTVSCCQLVNPVNVRARSRSRLYATLSCCAILPTIKTV